jgi:hypothetical protein
MQSRDGLAFSRADPVRPVDTPNLKPCSTLTPQYPLGLFFIGQLREVRWYPLGLFIGQS